MTTRKKPATPSSTTKRAKKVAAPVVRVPRVAKPKASQAGIPRPRTYQPSLLDSSKRSGPPPLMRMLYRKMHEVGMEPAELAQMLGISHAYLRSLLNTNRSTISLDHSVIRRAAEFLEIPAATAFVLAGLIQPEDFFYKPTLADSVEAAYQDMRNNGLWAGFAPSEETWKRLPKHVRLSIAVLYEQVVGKSLLQTAIVPLSYMESTKPVED